MDVTGSVGASASNSNSTSNQQFNGFIYTGMASVVGSSWFWLTISLAVAIHLVARFIFRMRNKGRIKENLRGVPPVAEAEIIKNWKYDDIVDGEMEEAAAAPSFSFKFQYQIPELPKDVIPVEPSVQVEQKEESLESLVVPSNKAESSPAPVVTVAKEEEKEEESPTVTEAPIVTSSIHSYRFLTENDFSGFIKEPETMTVSVQESHIRPEGEERRIDDAVFDAGFLSVEDFEEPEAHPGHVQNGAIWNAFVPVNELDESESVVSEKDKPLERRKPNSTPSSSSSWRKGASGMASLLSEDFSGFDSDSESSRSDGYSVKELVVDSDSDWFLSEKDFPVNRHGTGASEDSASLSRYRAKVMTSIRMLEEAKAQFFYHTATESADSRSQITLDSPRTDSLKYSDYIWSGSDSPKVEFEEQELKEEEDLKEAARFVYSRENEFGLQSSLHNSDARSCAEEYTESVSDSKNSSENSDKEFDRAKDHSTREDNAEQDDGSNQHVEDLVHGKETVEEQEDRWRDLTPEEEDELESLWEHQDLIEQLKTELKKVRAIGLPTILEESESPKAMEDLKPWKIDAKFLREDPMDELHKFYKSYRERMRKFDILCYQKMYAIDFLQLKDPVRSKASQKPLRPTVTSILSQNSLSSRRKPSDDPSEQFLKELRCDLETVYVGQTCLSWEFLRWQYEQARDLPDSDPYRSHQYNQVAGEFQQFQVIVQRFIEDESFQGPRLPNYVNNRCVLRNLLQVPVIKEDCLKDRLEEQRKGLYTITSDELEDIMEESIRVFWEFVKADKDESPGLLKGLMGTHVELQEPSDYEFMMHIHAILQKKEKRLKDLLRTGNCLVKKFKKPKEDRSNQDQFFSQVDMKLVSRVLKMTRITTDQLQWCHTKLDKITFIDRKIHREPSFLLFPC